jgi:opacity protein-like surface antigen
VIRNTTCSGAVAEDLMIKGCCAAAFLVMLVPSVARADWLFTPAVAYAFGGDTVDRDHAAFGFGIGLIDEESFAFEADFGYAPQFFTGSREDFTGSGSVLTLMGNVLVAAPRIGVLPYLTGGVGYMQMRVTSDFGQFTSTTRETGYNAGGGLIAFFGERIGIRGEVRYFRSFQNQVPSWTRGIRTDIAPSAFDFWRAGVGLTLRTRQ